MSKTITLSSAGIKNVICDKKEFVFVFGKHEIRMNNFNAEFISPIVSRMHLADPTINSIHYECIEKKDFPRFDDLFTNDIIDQIHLLSNGSHVSLNTQQINKLLQISIFLSNSELFNELQAQMTDKNIDEYFNSLQIYEYISKKQGGQDFDLSSIVDTISKNFNSIDTRKLQNLPKSLLFKIISNAKLQIEDEDSLFDFITETFKDTEDESDESPDLVDFYEIIDFRNLSDEKFKEAIQSISPAQITNQLWKNLCSRFLKGITDNKYETFEFDPKNEKVFDGIMNYLSQKAGKNIHDNGTIEIISNSIQGTYYPKNLVDYNQEKLYYSDDSKLATICFDFKDKLIQPTSYKIKTSSNRSNCAHLKNWVIEISKDGNNYIEIDRHENDSTMNGPLIYATFHIKEKTNEFYRFIRLRQTGNSWHDSGHKNYIGFRHLDFYGKIKIPK